jgi:hypothetical protein
MIEQAVLSSIQTTGLAIGGNIYKSVEVMFDGPFPNFRTDQQNTTVLYCPWNIYEEIP